MDIHLNELKEILKQYYGGSTPAIKEFKVLFNNGTTISLRWKDQTDTRLIKALRVNDAWKIFVQS